MIYLSTTKETFMNKIKKIYTYILRSLCIFGHNWGYYNSNPEQYVCNHCHMTMEQYLGKTKDNAHYLF